MAINIIRRLISHSPRGKGMAGRLISQHFPRTAVFDMIGPLEGLRMYLDTSDQFQAQMLLASYQPELVAEIHKLIRPGDVVLTAGAHVGYMMLAMARLGATVIGAECDPNLIAQCQRNLELNNLDTRLLPFGLGLDDGTLTMNVSMHPGQSSFSIPHWSISTVTAKVRRGDGVLQELGIDKLDGLLIDVEGWEAHLLQGLEQTLKRHPPRWAVVECFEVALENAGSSGARLKELLADFRLNVIHQIGDDLICRQPQS